MIRVVAFDLDGVLVDSRDAHFHALNQSLSLVGEEFVISRKDHEQSFDGLPTKVKLDKLSNERGLSQKLHPLIWENKQKFSSFELERSVKEDRELQIIFEFLKNRGIKCYIATNSIKRTSLLIAKKLGVFHLVDGILTNEDVKKSKPSPEIYLKIIDQEGILPEEMLIFEDSDIGIQAAKSSGAFFYKVSNRKDVNFYLVQEEIERRK